MTDINAILVKQNTTLKEAMQIIDRNGMRMAVVVDGLGKLAGMVTDGDIRRGILSGIGVNEAVSLVFNRNSVFARAHSSKAEILELFRNNRKKDITGIPLVTDYGEVKDFALLSESAGVSYWSEKSAPHKKLKRVLVIGGAGYIGSLLTRTLLEQGYAVTVLDKFMYGADSLQGLEKNRHVRIFKGDTRHIEDVTRAMKDADAVVHLAELVGDPASALNPVKTQEINYLATQTVALIAKHFQINRFIYLSSCSVYGASANADYLSEMSPLAPLSLYAKMKVASENGLWDIQDNNFCPTVLRLATVFGYSFRPRFDLIVNLLTAQAVREKKITIFGGGQWRPHVHVADVADAIIAMLESPLEVIGGEVFNVGCQENNHTIKQIGVLVRRAVPSATVCMERNHTDERSYKTDFSKLRTMVPITLKRSVWDGIIEIKNYLERERSVDYHDKKYHNIRFLENKA